MSEQVPFGVPTTIVDCVVMWKHQIIEPPFRAGAGGRASDEEASRRDLACDEDLEQARTPIAYGELGGEC